MEQYLPWIILGIHVTILLCLDLFVFHKTDKITSPRKAVYETIFFVSNALLFCGVVYWSYKSGLIVDKDEQGEIITAGRAVFEYLIGYIIELSLSVDNLFVIAIIFTSYKIPNKFQHRLLFFGILGAIIFRGVLITVGIALVHAIHQVTILFGLFLLYSAFKMLKKEAEHEEEEVETKGIAKFFNITNIIDEGKFVTEKDGKRVYTALFGALITIEFTDLLFALDSIPAIFAITTSPFLVMSSNIFAIMGLRSLYFFLADMLEKFAYIKYSVFSILIFVSLKLMTGSFFKIPEWFSLLFIIISLGVGIRISMIKIRTDELDAEKEKNKVAEKH